VTPASVGMEQADKRHMITRKCALLDVFVGPTCYTHTHTHTHTHTSFHRTAGQPGATLAASHHACLVKAAEGSLHSPLQTVRNTEQHVGNASFENIHLTVTTHQHAVAAPDVDRSDLHDVSE
jgi:hypothetical protein